MNSKISSVSAVFIAALVFGVCLPASAATIILIDVNGNGSIDFGTGPTFIPGSLQQDPGPGGQSAVLTYTLNAPNLTEGDLLLNFGGKLQDVIRFNPAGSGGDPNYLASVLFYASSPTGMYSLADTSQPPFANYANTLAVAGIVSGGTIGGQYTPLSGQPGYVPNFAVSYAITGDTVPEPSSVSIVLSGVVVVAVLGRKQLLRARYATSA